MHSMIFWNHIRNQETKLNQMCSKSQFPNFFLGMVYTLHTLCSIRTNEFDHSLILPIRWSGLTMLHTKMSYQMFYQAYCGTKLRNQTMYLQLILVLNAQGQQARLISLIPLVNRLIIYES